MSSPDQARTGERIVAYSGGDLVVRAWLANRSSQRLLVAGAFADPALMPGVEEIGAHLPAGTGVR